MIEFRGKRLEHTRALKGGDRGRHRVERGLWIVENGFAPQFTKGVGVRGFCDLGNQRGYIGVIHFHRVEQRLLGLFFQRVGTAVPKMTARRHALAVPFNAAKARRRREVHHGRRVARAELVGPATLRHPDQRVVVAGKAAPGIVARGAGRACRFRQVAVEKQAQAELLARRQGRLIDGGGERQDKRVLRPRREREQEKKDASQNSSCQREFRKPSPSALKHGGQCASYARHKLYPQKAAWRPPILSTFSKPACAPRVPPWHRHKRPAQRSRPAGRTRPP